VNALSAAASQPQGESPVLAHIAAELPHLTANPLLGNTVFIDHLYASRNSENCSLTEGHEGDTDGVFEEFSIILGD
jgi:hypothetical protein